MSGTSQRKPEDRHPVFEPLAETIKRVVENVTTRTGRPEFETGLRVVDKGIFGLHRSQLTVIAARPGIGKTALVCQAATHLAKKGYKVAFLSLEMTKETILERMFCLQYEINGWDLIMGKVTADTQRKLSLFLAEYAKLGLRIIDDYCHTENELYTLVEHLEFRPEVIILDHLQHIQSISRKSTWETLTEYLRYMKQLAMKYKIAVVCLSQINRQGDEKPQMTNLKGTGGIEEMADHVLLMHQLEDANTDGTNFEISVAKNRFGPVGNFSLYFDKAKYKFFNDYPNYKEIPERVL